MNFIIPQNYKYRNKFLGFVDYHTLITNIIFDIILFKLLNIFISDIFIQLIILIIICLPLLLISILFSNNENVFNILLFIFNYVNSPKIYIYNKNK